MSIFRSLSSRNRSFTPTPPATPVPETSPSTPYKSPTFDSRSDDNFSSDAELKAQALSLRLTCPTPTFNQFTKFTHLASGHADVPVPPTTQRGEGTCNFRQYADYKTTFTDVTSPPTSEASSRFYLKMRRSQKSLRSATDGSSEGGDSRGPSPAVPFLTEKPLPPLPLPPLFSPCTSPTDENYHVVELSPVVNTPVPLRPRFKIRRKPVPDYLSPIPFHASDLDSSSEYSSDESSEPGQASAL
ncbi:hypothetical protein B0H11DRAFT_582340 [Mycena galericulata]|nr:hypothetical protein B0H11DRAFT_582340 [Mycena galericulata]